MLGSVPSPMLYEGLLADFRTCSPQRGSDPFCYSARKTVFDWRFLYSVDCDGLIKTTDTATIEKLLKHLQQGNVELERSLEVENYIHLFRLLQLAVEYLCFLHDAHEALTISYSNVNDAAIRWKSAAQEYILAGQTLVAEVEQDGMYQPETLSNVQAARTQLEVDDTQYNSALDALEAEERAAQGFRFRRHRCEMDWRRIHSINIDELVSRGAVEPIQRVLPALIGGSIQAEDPDQLTTAHCLQLVRLAQCALDLCWHAANMSGAQLEEAQRELYLTSADIPALTTATEELQIQLQDIHSRANRPSSTTARTPSPSRPGTAAAGLPTHLHIHTGSSSQQQPVEPPGFYPSPELSPAVGSPVLATAALPSTPSTLQSSTSKLQAQMENIEKTLRDESSRMEEMRTALERMRATMMQPTQPEVPALPPRPSSPRPQSPGPGNGKLKILVDEHGIRANERMYVTQHLRNNVERLKERALREHSMRLQVAQVVRTSSMAMREPAALPGSPAAAASPTFAAAASFSLPSTHQTASITEYMSRLPGVKVPQRQTSVTGTKAPTAEMPLQNATSGEDGSVGEVGEIRKSGSILARVLRTLSPSRSNSLQR